MKLISWFWEQLEILARVEITNFKLNLIALPLYVILQFIILFLWYRYRFNPVIVLFGVFFGSSIYLEKS